MYFKKVNYNSNKDMFNFLINHFSYPTMNSWNGVTSIANNVKVYNIPVLDDAKALEALEEDNYQSINLAIKDWEEDHPGYEVFFNGRSGGYLVLGNKRNNSHVFAEEFYSPCEYINANNPYEAWKEDVREYYGSLKEYQPNLIEQVKLVQDFDKLCDDLVDLTKLLISELEKRKSLTRKYSATLRFQRYHYETLEDLKLHMLDMKRRNYSVWEWDPDELWVEYEMNEGIDSEIVLEKEGEEDFI